jgi:hypothetical protein
VWLDRRYSSNGDLPGLVEADRALEPDRDRVANFHSPVTVPTTGPSPGSPRGRIEPLLPWLPFAIISNVRRSGFVIRRGTHAPRTDRSALLLGLTLAPLSPALAANNDAAKMCQKTGWTKLYRSDGTKFTSETDCVSYAAKGGKILTASPATLIASQDLQSDDPVPACPLHCTWGTITGTGLLPGATINVYTSEGLVGAGEIPSDGTFSLPSFIACGRGVSGLYATSLNAAGEPIQSNVVDSPCG